MIKGSKKTTIFEKSSLSAAICLGLFITATNAQALVLTAGAQVTVDGVTTSVGDTSSDSSAVYATNSDYSSTAGSARSAGRGNANGWMYSRAGGDGIFSAQGSIQQLQTFTNTSGVAQNYFFDFTINRGSLSAQDYGTGTGSFVEASNTVSITLDGMDIFTSNATLRNDRGATAPTLTTEGTVLGTYTAASDYYYWGSYTDTLDLGIVAAGDSFTLSYDILTFAASDIAYPASCVGGFGGGGDEIFFGNGDGDGDGGCGRAYSQFGDPNGISGMPISNATVSGVPAVAVPEPGTLLLMGGGVLGLAFARRRRNYKR